MEALHDIDIHPADGFERPRFVLAVLELAFLMRRQGLANSLSNSFPELPQLHTAKKGADACLPAGLIVYSQETGVGVLAASLCPQGQAPVTDKIDLLIPVHN